MLKFKNSGSSPSLKISIPENPLIQPVKEVAVLPVYVIISFPIFIRPYEFGNPAVLLTLITSSILKTTSDVVGAVAIKGSSLKESISFRLAILDARSTVPYSCS